MKTHRLIHFLSLLCCALVLSGCAGPRQVELPLAKLQAGVERRFPLQNRMLELFEVRFTSPQVQLLPDTGRVGLAMDAAVAPPFINQSWGGRLVLSGRLYIDAARGAVYMAEPRIDRFNLDGIDPSRMRQLEGVANTLIGKIVTDIPVYSFRAEELRFAGVQFVPTALRTTTSALVVTLEPVK